MPNDWFQFKQFKINQELCAMKVSTDACIQGAWAAHLLEENLPIRILDIGTGTGLLSLMIAQQNPTAVIDAIELHEDAYQQARLNFEQSPWSGNLQAKHIPLQEYSLQMGHVALYDFIVCNPPFFHNHLQSSEKARKDARHSISLSKTELAKNIVQLLKEDGHCCVLYPATEWDEWIKVASGFGLKATRILNIKPKQNAAVNRIIGLFSKTEKGNSTEETLVIYEEDRNYTSDFRSLLKAYYLAL